MSALGIIGIVGGGLFAAYLVQRALQTRRVAHWMWMTTRPSTPGRPREKRRPAPARWVAAIGLWLSRRPLRVMPFGGIEKADPVGVSAALNAAMARIGSSGRSNVDVVTAPIEAGSAVEDLAGAIRTAPSGGNLAESLLRLGARLVARGELQLGGHVLASDERGPGLALTLADARGNVLAREMLWATDFEPRIGMVEQPSESLRSDRVLLLATAGAVWTHFAVLQEVWGLREKERAELLGTSSWRSYAAMQVAVEGRERWRVEVTRALHARAVDADIKNRDARFNLAALELRDRQLSTIRPAGKDRLQELHDELQLEETGRNERHDALKDPERLVHRNPLHYQVAYKLMAAKLNDAIDSEGANDGRTTDSLGERDLEDLTTHLHELEETLTILERSGDGGHEQLVKVDAVSGEFAQLRDLLRRLEGPMLVLWAMVALRIKRGGRPPWTVLECPQAIATREALLDELERGSLLPEQAVAFASDNARILSRMRQALACWYVDVGDWDRALRELELSLESGGEIARWTLSDRQLAPLIDHCPDEWRRIVDRYSPEHRASGDSRVERVTAVQPATTPSSSRIDS